jgi:hypothetical protein
MIKAWMKEKVLVSREYQNVKTYKQEDGLWRNGLDEGSPF